MIPIFRLAELGEIPHQDAAILLARCQPHEIFAALQSATVHELRDRTLGLLRDELVRRFP